MDHYGNHNSNFSWFEKCFCIQFLTFVEYNKKGLTYVKPTHEVYKQKKRHIKIMNVQLVMDFIILVKQNVMNYKVLDMDFYLTMCLCNVCETLGYKIFEV
jgi:hypothetical protein